MSLIKKVSIVLVCLMVFSFCVPSCVRADDGFGGKLLNPVMSLVAAIGDGIMSLVQKVTVGIDNTFIELNTESKDQNFWSAVGEWFSDNWQYVVSGVLAVAAVVVNVIPVAGQFASAALAIAAKALVGASIAVAVYGVVEDVNSGMLPDKLVLPTYQVTAKEIFSNEIPLTDVDFFNPTENQIIEYKDDEGNTQKIELHSTAGELQKTISSWYQILRDIAIVASLSILVYIGIRILISSTSNDKAKYKQMIVDWLVALCLLFVMQYIMSFSNIIVDKVTGLVGSINTNNYKPSDFGYSDDYEVSVEEGFQMYTITDEETVYNAYKKFVESWAETNGKEQSEAPMYNYFVYNDSGEAVSFYWPANNEMEQARINAQLLYDEKETWESIGYKIIYCVLVIFTCIFLFTYVRRVLYMAFLTIVAPLVAMTYPIDKINDGNAQAFNSWLKEYIFNLLLQPLHLVLYTILIGSAMDLASSNIVYVTCALGFMIPAEKLMRKFFGFTKADTPGMLAGAAGAGLMMAGMNKLLSRGPKGGKDNSGKGGESKSDKEDPKIRQKDDFDPDAINADQLDTNALIDEQDMMNNNEDEEKTDLQKMPDADYEDNWLGADNNEHQTLEANTIDDYGDGEGMNDYNKDDNANPSSEIDESSSGESSLDTNQGNKSKGSLRKAIGRSARYYGRGMANKVSNKLRSSHPGRRAIRMAGGAVLGATAGTIGLAAGIASGDPSKAFQFTTAGIAGGYKAGSAGVNNISNKVSNIPKALGVEGTGGVFKENYYGKDQYREKQIQQDIRQKQNDLELRWKLEDKLKSKDAADRYMKEALPEVTRYGDFDNKTIVAMAQMEAEGIKRNETIAAALISERDLSGKDSNNLGDKAATEFEKTMKRKGKERGLDGDNLDRFVKKSVGNINKLDKFRYK